MKIYSWIYVIKMLYTDNCLNWDMGSSGEDTFEKINNVDYKYMLLRINLEKNTRVGILKSAKNAIIMKYIRIITPS